MGPLRYLTIFSLVGWLLLTGCENSYLPKQEGYPKIDLPAEIYSTFDSTGYPFSFEYNKAAIVSPDRSKNSEPFWLNLHYPSFDANVQLTYKPINRNAQLLHEYVEDVRLLTNKHNIKASSIEETVLKTADGHNAYVFLLAGQVPTQFQFFTTDSTHHFFRGALYFKMADRNDSLQPVIDYIARDMQHLMKTLHWRKGNDGK